MKRIISLSFLFCLMVVALTGRSRAEDKCLTCHETLGDKASSLFKNDVHHSKGISCAGCHGGNPNAEEMEQAMDTAAGFIGVPKGDQISEACAKCHSSGEKMKSFGSVIATNQWEMLQASVHGRLALNGKEHIAQCITCHNAHGIVHVHDPSSPVFPLNVVGTCAKCHSNAEFIRQYSPAMPVDQLEKYRTSLHGILNSKGDSKPAQCQSCHGSHDIRAAKDVKSSVYAVNLPATCSRCHSDPAYMKQYAIPTDQFAKFSKSVHGVALLEKHDVSAPACNDCHGNHGAAPPGVESVSMVCGSCHALNADLFSSSPHKKAFDDRHLPECETCHSNHAIAPATNALVGISPDATCVRCHSPSQNQKGFAVAKEMRLMVDSLTAVESTAEKLIGEAEQKGMEISEAKFKLRDTRQARLQSRTVIHAFNKEKFHEVVDKGLSNGSTVESDARQAIHEYYFRRWGLGIATVIISIVAVALYVTIRRIERRQKSSSHANTR